MRLNRKTRHLLAFGFVLFFSVTFTPVLVAEVPDLINYQGYLTDASGNPVPDGTYAMIFTLYTTEEGDTGVWSQNSTAVSIIDGIYNVQLGPFTYPTQVFDGDLYLEVEVNGEILSPRQRVSATAYAMRAVVADSVADGGITNVMIADNAVDSQKLSDNAVDSTKVVNNSLTAADIQDGDGSGLDADLLDGFSSADFVRNTQDYGRSGIAANLYEGSSTLTSKYVNASGDIMNGSTSGGLLSVTNSYAGGAGVAGYCLATNGSGVLGQGASRGVWGYSSSPGDGVRGIYGQATNDGGYQNYGGYFTAAGADGVGVFGEASGSSGHAVSTYASGANGYGVYSYASGTNGRGVFGIASNSGSVTNYGGYFTAGGTTGRGVYGRSSNASGRNYGGYFEAMGDDGRGVYGKGQNRGGYFIASGVIGQAVYGKALDTGSVENYGGYFEASGETGRGVYGRALNTGSVTNYGGYFRADGRHGRGVYSEVYGAEGRAVEGVAKNTGSEKSVGVVGVANGENSCGVGGYSGGANGIGVLGQTDGTYGHAVEGYSEYSSGYAGYFIGRGYFSGYLEKSGGGFKIDHPLDPENKYLNHSFVESPDMMNVYNGNVILDDEGEAWVELPDYFKALNSDFRYQLTPIGAPGPNLYVAEEIDNNQFKIAGGQPGMKVSWQVTGIRQDPWAEANRPAVEEDKPDKELGYYMHPKEYGQPEEKSIEWARDPEGRQRMKEEREKRQASNS